MFIIHKHYEATNKNKNFAGQVKDYYSGRGEQPFGNKLPAKWFAESYAYKSRALAARGLQKAREAAEDEMRYGFWKISVELIEI